MFESRIFAGALEKLFGCEISHAKAIAWSDDVGGHAKKCVEDFAKRQLTKVEQLHKVSTPCLDDNQFKKWQTEGALSKVCSQILSKCLYM